MKNCFLKVFTVLVYSVAYCLVIIPLNGQTQKTVFQHITTKNGLSQNFIDCIYRDSRGLMWFGTWEGLNYYNGYNVIIYRNDSSGNSISNNFVQAICEDSTGALWIGTQNGLNRFNFEKNEFTRYYHIKGNFNSISGNKINFLMQDRNKNIWVSTNESGLDKISFQSGNLIYKHYQHNINDPNTISSNEVYCTYEDTEGNIWIGTINGLNCLNTKTGNITKYFSMPGNFNGLTNNTITTIAESKPGVFWIGTKFGLTQFNVKQNQFKQYWSSQNDPNGLASIAIKAIIKDLEGNILIATLDGLYQYNPENDNFNRFESNTGEEFSLNNNFINSLLCDQDGNVWVGTEKGGVNKFNIYSQRFYNFTYNPNENGGINSSIVNSVYEDNDYLWIGTAGGGLNEYSKKTHTFRYHKFIQSNLKTLSSNYISGITRDSRGTLWISTWGGGINRFENFTKGTFKYYSYVSVNTDSLNWNLVSCMHEFPKGNLWIGSYLGLSYMNIKTEKFKVLQTSNLLSNPLKTVGCLYVDSHNNLWAGTENGLYRLKWNDLSHADFGKPDSIFCYRHIAGDISSLAGNFIISILEDKNGDIWFSAYGFGLEKLVRGSLKGNTAKFVHYNKSTGLPNSIIYGIMEDNTGNLWLGTENGLSRFNTKENKFQNFNESDGIQGNQFYWGSYFKNKDGRMYFGGTKGLTSFNPKDILPNPTINKIIFTDLKIFNKSIPVSNASDKTILSRHLSSLESINIHYRQNMFSVEFAALNYDLYNSIIYAYKLDGFDQDWITVDDNRRFATYTNLSPGNYTLHVKAANRDGIWTNSENALVIHILPEWWQTLSFKISISIFGVLTLLLIYFQRINSFKSQQRKLELMVEQRTEVLRRQTKEILLQKYEIDQQNQKLQSYGSHLEEMVKERTYDLEVAKNRAEEADRLKSSFLANLSHEIRTPLNAIVGFSGLIANADPGSDPVIDWSKIILKNNTALLNLIDDIIDFSKIETGQINITNENFKLYDLISDIIQAYRMKASQNLLVISPDVELKISIDEKDKNIEAFADTNRVTQIINNLINNAIKFTSEGFIEIGFKPENDQIMVWVKDTGIGLEKKNLEVIFERFRKVEENENKVFRGTGLGLAIVKNLIEVMGGKIWVESKYKNGATFFFTINRNTSKKVEEVQVLPSKPINKNYPVLIAEDEELNFLYLESLLQKHDIKVVWAQNGKEAVTLCEKNQDFKLILMDIKMPVMNGIEATKMIKKFAPNIPIIAVTAYALFAEKQDILKADFDEYVTKPILETYLLKLIDKYLRPI